MTWKPDSIVGKLNKRITIQQNNATRDDYGAPAPPSWTNARGARHCLESLAKLTRAAQAQAALYPHGVLRRFRRSTVGQG